MKYIKLFESFEDILSRLDIHKICEKYGITNYTINSDRSIDAESIDLSHQKLTRLPLKFNHISRYFVCSNNLLTSLEGCPSYVGSIFHCHKNQLTSFKGCPNYVGGEFNCDDNQLTSLQGSPNYVGGHFYCHDNRLISFNGFPNHVGKFFYCQNNPIYNIWILFGDSSKIELFNDCDIIQDGLIVLSRLNYFLEEIGKPTVTEVVGYKQKGQDDFYEAVKKLDIPFYQKPRKS